MIQNLASYHHCIQRIRAKWRPFLEKRCDWLQQQERHGTATEKVAENILQDLFTEVLDWPLSDLNNQIGYADLLLTSLGIKYLIVEVKRPGALAWNHRAVEEALDQAMRYADEQKVKCVGVSDGVMLYAADIQHGGLHDRVFVSLESQEPPDSLFWLSVHGIYRPRSDSEDAALHLLPEALHEPSDEAITLKDAFLHPKYKIPAHCFAYIGDACDPRTWKLPFRLADGNPDVKRLPKAIQAVLSNYRGVKVSGIPERDIPEVLVRLAMAAVQIGKMPHQSGEPSPVYQQLSEALEQLGRLDEITIMVATSVTLSYSRR